MLGEDSTKTAAPNNDCVEGACVALWTAVRSLSVLVNAVERLVQSVAHVPTEDIDREVSELRNFAGCHSVTSPYVFSGVVCALFNYKGNQGTEFQSFLSESAQARTRLNRLFHSAPVRAEAWLYIVARSAAAYSLSAEGVERIETVH